MGGRGQNRTFSVEHGGGGGDGTECIGALGQNCGEWPRGREGKQDFGDLEETREESY